MGWWPAFGRLVPAGNDMYSAVFFQLGNTCPTFGGVVSYKRVIQILIYMCLGSFEDVDF